jgi:cellulase (glycosyl hydrolase family 5)/predicted xylan-binding protein with Ca-dependent carbohydrate-binding module
MLGTLLAGLCLGNAQARASGVIFTAHAAQATLSGWNLKAISDPSASNGTAVEYGGNGTVEYALNLPTDADTLTLRVRGDQCSGPPAYTVTIDGLPALSGTVASTTWTLESYTHFLGAGRHTIETAYTNDYSNWQVNCDRNLYLDGITISASTTLVAPGNPPIPAGFVHQAQTKLLDGTGRPLQLRGANVGGDLDWEGWIWGPGTDYVGESTMMANLTRLVGAAQAQQFQTGVYTNFLTGADFRAMSERGLNVARVPFNYQILEDNANPYVYKASGWAALDQVVQAAEQNNVYLVLDMHVAPCSQAMSFTSDYVPGSGANFLWWSSACQARTVAMWKAIAARYANDNVIAGYDLLNESVTSNSQLLSLYERITAAIRSVDPNHLIIYEGNNAARDFSLFTAPLDANEMLSAHDYSWMLTNQDLTSRMPAYDAVATRLNAPMWIGEFGQDNYAGIQHYVSTLNADPLIAGWADWTWKQSPGFPALATIQESPDAQLLLQWMDNPLRLQPTQAQAKQGMSDFLTDIQYANTVPDAQMAQILGR